ncbi:heat-inducible transcriptional repressor HrcA [Corynebacterium sp. S7]
MANATETRRQAVLRAIVADYIALQESVGSKALVDRHQLKVSPATIRNDMAALEEQGYIQQQHASSGRMPTEKGYRAFVDSIHEVKPLSAAERRAIIEFIERGVDLEDVLRRSAQLLAQFTRQAAVVQLPTLNVSRVKHCEVVSLSPRRLLLVLITDAGRVDQRNVELSRTIDDAGVAALRDMFNNALQGKTLADASTSVAELAATAPPEIADHVMRAATVLLETLVDQPTDRLIIAGAANLTHMPEGLHEVIDALEEQVVVLKLLTNVPELGDVSVRIGRENEEEGLSQAAVVTAGYGSDGETLGGLGVLGPTYMDYPGTIQKVAAVARYISRVLAGE